MVYPRCAEKRGARRETARRQEIEMQKYVCNVCGYVYDPEKGDPEGGIAPGTPFEDVPADWSCPLCGVEREMFEPLDE